MKERASSLRIKTNVKPYGKDRTLWYYDHQGEEYNLAMEVKGGYLVTRPEVEGSDMYKVKRKHAELLFEDVPDDGASSSDNEMV